jgi:hypothetical protein
MASGSSVVAAKMAAKAAENQSGGRNNEKASYQVIMASMAWRRNRKLFENESEMAIIMA